MYRLVFIRTGFEKLMRFHVTFSQSAYICLKQTKLVVTDNRPTKFHQSLSSFGNETHKLVDFTGQLYFLFMDFKSTYIYNRGHKKINSLTSVANNNTMAGLI